MVRSLFFTIAANKTLWSIFKDMTLLKMSPCGLQWVHYFPHILVQMSFSHSETWRVWLTFWLLLCPLQGSRNSSRSSSPSVRMMPPDKTSGRGYFSPDDPTGNHNCTNSTTVNYCLLHWVVPPNVQPQLRRESLLKSFCKLFVWNYEQQYRNYYIIIVSIKSQTATLGKYY